MKRAILLEYNSYSTTAIKAQVIGWMHHELKAIPQALGDYI